MPARPEGISFKLARNLVAARIAARMTQQQLADRADVSRATIAQLEAGIGDPKLSTVILLAAALQIDPFILLLGTREVNTFVSLTKVDLQAPRLERLRTSDLRELQRLVASGMIRDRASAARLGAAAAAAQGYAQQASIGAAIGAAILPGVGTVLGAALAELLAGRSIEESDAE